MFDQTHPWPVSHLLHARHNIQELNFVELMHASSPGAHELFLWSNPPCIPKDLESPSIADVVMHLPYYTVNHLISQHFLTYMINEERTIWLRVCFMFKNDVDQFYFWLIFPIPILQLLDILLWSWVYSTYKSGMKVDFNLIWNPPASQVWLVTGIYP